MARQSRGSISQDQRPPLIEILQAFDKRDEMIPMRDGVRLHTVIFARKISPARCPY